VSEWCADWLDAAYYLKSPVDDPPGPPMTAAFRSTYYPSSTGSEVVGFRVVQQL
jgi:hypothetical protein